MTFSVNALFYGDHADLASRLLDSLKATAAWHLISEVRLACNRACPATREAVFAFVDSSPVPGYVYEAPGGINVGKYRIMRKMFHDAERPLRGDRVMWFDDDSYVTSTHDWWLRTKWESDGCDLLGAVYRIRQRGGQFIGITHQPWYAGLPIGRDHKFKFCTGGWWVCKKAIIETWDYPWRELHHNGGDSLLGELVRQRGGVMYDYRQGVAINADADGNESKAKRRGIESSWPWEEYPSRGPSLPDFRAEVYHNGVKA